MIGRCLINRGADLDPPSRGGYYTNKTEFALVVGKSYLIYAMGLWRGGLEVLVRDETALPNWYPAVLLEIPAQPLPDDWEFVLLDGPHASGTAKLGEWGEGPWSALWGFSQLVRGTDFGDRLMERDPDTLWTFERDIVRRRLPQYTRVRITTERWTNEGVPAGATGWIMDAHEDDQGLAYEVEVTDDEGHPIGHIVPRAAEIEVIPDS